MVARKNFHLELQALQTQLLEMGTLVEASILDSVRSLAEQDMELANQVVAGDELFDAMEVDIESRCIELLALQQPMASDLRLIATTLKVVTDIERMADNAVNIAEITLRIGEEKLIKPLVDIPEMARIAVGMLRDVLIALVKQDRQLAESVCQRDDQVDDLYAGLFDELVGIMQQDCECSRIAQSTMLLFAARFLERIADHATNIGERVIYLVSGERVSY